VPPFDGPTWLAIAAVIAVGVLAMLYAIAGVIRDFVRTEALREEVNKLRRDYAERLRAIRHRNGEEDQDEEPMDIEIVEEAETKAA